MHILDNLVQMTSQRDHLRLEMSVLSTFLQLPSITQVRALALLVDDSGQWVCPRSWSEAGLLQTRDTDFADHPARQPLADYPTLAQCLAQQAPHAILSRAADEHVIWLPVWMHDQARICLEVTQSQPFTDSGLEVLMGIFQVYQNYQSLLDYSERDALTGLLNRKTFDEQLLRLVGDGKSTNTTLIPWLAVIDIDHFKQVNDRFGHLFGDEVLILVANLLRGAFSPQCRIFRFGGEEFVVLLPPMEPSSAHAALERLRCQVQDYPFPQLGRVSISIGFAGAKLCSPVEILGQADQALYYAKAHGRNQVCQYETLQNQGLLAAREISHDDAELF